MTTAGLRERKKQRTRRLIADTAARLFAERGYEHVAVRDVARAAEVSEPTVYNYFPTKERLVLDRDEEISDHLTRLIRARSPGVSPAAAIRHEALNFVEGIRSVPADQFRGGLGYLAAISPANVPRDDRPARRRHRRCSRRDGPGPEHALRQGARRRTGMGLPDHHR